MNQLTLHYVNHADRERDLAEDLRNRQILHAGRDATAARNHSESTQAGTAPLSPRQTAVRARAAAGR